MRDDHETGLETRAGLKNIFGSVLILAIVGGLCSGQLWVLVPAIAVLVFSPPSWDPAIRIKEAQIRAGHHPESRNWS